MEEGGVCYSHPTWEAEQVAEKLKKKQINASFKTY